MTKCCSSKTKCSDKQHAQVVIPAAVLTALSNGGSTGYATSTTVITNYVGAAFPATNSKCGCSAVSTIPAGLHLHDAILALGAGLISTSNGPVFGASITVVAGVVSVTLTVNYALANNLALTTSAVAGALFNAELQLDFSSGF